MPASWFERLSLLATRRVMWILFGVFGLLFGIFRIATSRLNALSGSVPMIDMHLSYTPTQVFEMVAAYGPRGRSLHMLTTLTADSLYPVDYSLLLALLIVSNYRQAFPGWGKLRYIALLPFITAGFDLLENSAAVTLLAAYPARPVVVARLASIFTTLKWVFVAISSILALVGVVAARLRK